MRCEGTQVGTLLRGEPVPLTLAPNYGLHISHSVRAQQWAINGGAISS